MKHNHTLLKDHIRIMNSYGVNRDHYMRVLSAAIEIKHDLNSESSVSFHIEECLKTLNEYDPELLEEIQSPLH